MGQADGARVPAAAVPRARDVAAARHDGPDAHGGDVAAARHDGADGHAAPDAGPGPADAVWHVGNPRAHRGWVVCYTRRKGTMPRSCDWAPCLSWRSSPRP